MIIKLFGATLILFSGSSIGWIISSHYLKRVEQLQELQLAVNIFETEISFGQTILAEAFKVIALGVSSPLEEIFKKASLTLLKSEGRSFSEIWNELLTEECYSLALLEDDIDIVREWGEQIGASSLDNQSKINKLTLKRLEQAEKRARDDADKRVKLARYSGVLISLLVIILFY